MPTEPIKWVGKPVESFEHKFVKLIQTITNGHLIKRGDQFMDICFQQIIAMMAAAPVEKKMAIEQVADRLKRNPIIMELEVERFLNDILYKTYPEFGMTQAPEETAALPSVEREVVLQVAFSVAQALIQAHINDLQNTINFEFQLPDWQIVEEPPVEEPPVEEPPVEEPPVEEPPVEEPPVEEPPVEEPPVEEPPVEEPPVEEPPVEP